MVPYARSNPVTHFASMYVVDIESCKSGGRQFWFDVRYLDGFLCAAAAACLLDIVSTKQADVLLCSSLKPLKAPGRLLFVP